MKQAYNKETNAAKLNKIVRLIESSPNAAKICLEKYTKKYPKDTWSHILYGSVLITLNHIEEANEELDKARDCLFQSSILKKDETRFNNARRSIIFNRLRIFGYQKKAKEFLKIYRANKNLLPEVKNDDVQYFEYMLGNQLPNYFLNTYFGKQLTNYKEERFIEHVKGINRVESQELKNPEFSYFRDDFPYEKIVDEIKKLIPSEKKKKAKFYNNIYIFKYSDCGTVGEKVCDYFCVITFDDSNHFIQMYPISTEEDIEYIDLNYLKEKKEKVKSISMIDKFNKRYGIN